MEHFAGLDVSVNETSVCIVDEAGKIAREVKVASKPASTAGGAENPTYYFKRMGLKPGRCRNGCSALLPKQACQRSALRRGNEGASEGADSIRPTATMRAA